MDINVQWYQVKNCHPEASEKMSNYIRSSLFTKPQESKRGESTYSLKVSTKMDTLKRVQSLNVWFSYLEN